MRKIILPLFLAISLVGCKTQMKDVTKVDPNQFSKTITSSELSDYLYTFSSDDFQGRDTGEPGQKKAAEYLKDYYNSLNIQGGSFEEDDTYFQTIPSAYFNDKYKASENVISIIKGSQFPEEYLVITSHYDHVGMKDGEIYNGADDDGSGTVAIMEIAEAFQKAVSDGYRPKRSIVFLHVTAEEKGLLGSKYYSENPIYPLENTVANLNIDMIGRIDEAHQDHPNYVYLIGSDKLSTDLHEISEKANSTYTNLNLDYTYNDENDPNRFYYRSDHYNFAKFDIPIIFYFNGVHEDYHQPTDTAEKIEYDLLEKRARLVFFTAWEIANRDERPFVDKPTL
ncbi:M20/M25/M40 family metallo-hydrolase [Psychroflexus gondwanensis]|uniref:M28 family metallopeptidase n=1 Tax=Psychroflexus gondwanensis TaxID=251 RepID=UPI0011BFE1A1|nr:M28 family metallopeptidase [Psychroflexus gondwanensis]TXE20188.1 M20/M25/M40 family metallo-hydrolase [Psychroflexus gondwanensis]